MEIVGTVKAPYKLFLPQSLIPAQWDGVLCFKLRNDFLGVAEFSAPEGSIVIPEQLLTKYGLSIGDKVDIEQASLPPGTKITLKAEESLDWKHVLEEYLPRRYTTLQEGQEIMVEYNGMHKITVVKTEPSPAICIIDTDLDLELDAPDPQPTQTIKQGSFLLSTNPLVVEVDSPVTVTVDGVAFIGPVHATSNSSYTDRVTQSIIMKSQFSICGEGSAVIDLLDSKNTAPGNSTLGSDSESVCANCGKQVPLQSMTLHQAFCAKHTVKCAICAQPFHEKVPDDHWHCEECGHSETNHYKQSHTREHQYETCECGYSGLFKDLARHRTTDCPNKLILCQFCHLLMPQGVEDPVNRIQGLSEHEAQCGTKTAECPQCAKVVLVKQLASHLLHHDQVRKDRAIIIPTLCMNQNCPYIVAPPGKPVEESKLGLCDNCYGVVYVTQHDPDHSKLRARIERRYLIQLTRGCGNSWCANKHCASGTGIKKPFKDATALAKTLALSEEFWLCVDKTAARRAMFLMSEPEFQREWKGMAISMCSSESEARSWLVNNAPRIDGS